jgi:hypothetical protein
MAKQSKSPQSSDPQSIKKLWFSQSDDETRPRERRKQEPVPTKAPLVL